MVRTDDGMKGVVEMVKVPGYELEERRIVYVDRGEQRIAGKREVWTAEVAPPRKLREDEILLVAHAADQQLRALDSNSPFRWWEMKGPVRVPHDPELCRVISDYLRTRV